MSDEIKKTCKYCKNEIKKDAIVCGVCSKYQNWFQENMAHSISFLVFLLAVVQLIFASIERSKAEDAYNEAMDVKNEIKTAENNILNVSKAVVIISEILPRATGYGAGLTENDKLLLQESIEILKRYKVQLDE